MQWWDMVNKINHLNMITSLHPINSMYAMIFNIKCLFDVYSKEVLHSTDILAYPKSGSQLAITKGH